MKRSSSSQETEALQFRIQEILHLLFLHRHHRRRLQSLEETTQLHGIKGFCARMGLDPSAAIKMSAEEIREYRLQMQNPSPPTP